MINTPQPVKAQLWTYKCPTCNSEVVAFKYHMATRLWYLYSAMLCWSFPHQQQTLCLMLVHFRDMYIRDNARVDGDPMSNPPEIRYHGLSLQFIMNLYDSFNADDGFMCGLVVLITTRELFCILSPCSLIRDWDWIVFIWWEYRAVQSAVVYSRPFLIKYCL